MSCTAVSPLWSLERLWELEKIPLSQRRRLRLRMRRPEKEHSSLTLRVQIWTWTSPKLILFLFHSTLPLHLSLSPMLGGNVKSNSQVLSLESQAKKYSKYSTHDISGGKLKNVKFWNHELFSFCFLKSAQGHLPVVSLRQCAKNKFHPGLLSLPWHCQKMHKNHKG